MAGVNIWQALIAISQLSEAHFKMQTLINKAKSEGRDINPDELLALDISYEKSFDNLDKTIMEAMNEQNTDGSTDNVGN